MIKFWYEWLFWILLALLVLLFLAGGCSANQQKAVGVLYPDGRYQVRLELNKVNFLYWSKFQADTDTFGMTAKVYNAEGRPDAESIKAISQSILEAVAQALAAKP